MSKTAAGGAGPGRPILFHAINHIGLGHLSRLSAIALSVRERAGEIPLMFAVDGSSHGLLEALGLPFVSVAFSQTAGADWSERGRDRLRAAVADSLIATLSPSVVVFDLLPDGELLRAARERGIPRVLCVRKTKNMAERVRAAEAFARDFTLILVAHAPTEIDVPAGLRERTKFVGTIVRPLGRSPVRTGRTVVVTGGGGGYPGTVEFYNRALEAFSLCRRRQSEMTGVLVTGPLFQDWSRLRPVEGIEIRPFDPELTATFASAGVVVCQAGYNTVAEVQLAGVPAICVPAERALDDQFERAARVVTDNPQMRLCPGEDPAVLADLIMESVNGARPRSMLPAPEGGRLAAEHLLRVAGR